MLVRLLHGYQEVAPLQMREIWALHAVLRLALIDELRRIALRVEDSAWRRGPRPMNWPTRCRERRPCIARAGRRCQLAGRALLRATSSCSSRTACKAWASAAVRCWMRCRSNWRGAAPPSMTTSSASMRGAAPATWPRATSSPACARWPPSTGSRCSNRLRAWRRCCAHAPDYVACDRRTRARYRASIEQLARVARRPEPAVTAELLAVCWKRRWRPAPRPGRMADRPAAHRTGSGAALPGDACRSGCAAGSCGMARRCTWAVSPC